MQEQDRPADASEPKNQTESVASETGDAGTARTRSDQTRLDQTRFDQTRFDQTRSDQTMSDHPAGSDATPEVMPSMQELLKQAELAAQEHHDAWLRAKAETENMRKRAQIDVANAHKYALENFALQLLPVRDSLEAALAIPEQTLESLKSGVEITLKQLISAFENVNIKEIHPLGEILDPHKHEAMTTVESDAAHNSIVSVFQKGYELNERLVRPALVSVAKSKDS